MNAFEILGLAPRLVLPDAELGDAFRQAGKTAHPDAGGGEGEFAALRQAHATLASPSRRLRHWLELQGMAAELRGTIDPQVMDLFTEVGTVTQQAEVLLRKRDAAKSVLVRAMLERETQTCREAVEAAITRLDALICEECEIFQEWESSGTAEIEAASKIARNLAFLEKWKAGLRSCFSRLV